MKSKDVKALTREELAQKFNEALKTNDPEQVAQAMADMAEGIQNEIMERAQSVANIEQLDAQALSSRGLRQLTSSEKKYYEKLIEAMKSDNPKQALSSLEVTMPETIIEDVFEDLRREHPLLAAINFQNTTYVTEWILSKNGKQKAKWGAITAEVTKELEGEFEKMNMTLNSLTAWLPVAKSMLDLGAQWLDSYVREVLKDAIYCGLEEAIVAGTGIDMPIGMMKDLSASKTEEEAYPDKTAVKITRFDAQQYGGVIAKLALSRNNRPRKVAGVIMVVNPVDYFAKVMPATTVQRPDGTFANDVLPYPTTVIQCEEVPAGKAVVGIADKYFMGMGTSKDGVIEYDDSYKFLQRERVYAAFLYGNGKPLDNNAFTVLDISALEPMVYVVETGTKEVVVEKTAWTEEELNALTVDKIKGLAAYKGYEITKTVKAEVIAEFLAAQEAAEQE
ncbi:phage major capsid protein [Faecalicatena faecalis]|uniref:phage major capsid protein n=1 Tax=Faecalicatena faecalis TaxID=2726362 RepID=UPI001FEC3741|nr:phage major capsid protein [Faecalicatena faecalis]